MTTRPPSPFKGRPFTLDPDEHFEDETVFEGLDGPPRTIPRPLPPALGPAPFKPPKRGQSGPRPVKALPPPRIKGEATGGWDLIRGDDVEAEEVRWLWYPYIPAAKLTSIEGDPGVGKSWITAALVTAISNGTPLPGEVDGRLPPQHAMMLSGEDGLADTMIPRLQSLRANMNNIWFPSGIFTLDSAGVRKLEKSLRSAVAAVVFIDPIQLFMGGKVDMNKANEVRELMGELYGVAASTGCAVIIVRHLRKNGEGPALYRGLGSIDFAASVRSMLHAHKTKDGTCIIEHVKCNLAPLGKPIEYELLDPATNPKRPFIWKGYYNTSARAACATAPSESVARAQAWLQTRLAAGPVLSQTIISEGAAQQPPITHATLVRAKTRVVDSIKMGSAWGWALKATGPSLRNDPPSAPEDDPALQSATSKVIEEECRKTSPSATTPLHEDET